MAFSKADVVIVCFVLLVTRGLCIPCRTLTSAQLGGSACLAGFPLNAQHQKVDTTDDGSLLLVSFAEHSQVPQATTIFSEDEVARIDGVPDMPPASLGQRELSDRDRAPGSGDIIKGVANRSDAQGKECLGYVATFPAHVGASNACVFRIEVQFYDVDLATVSTPYIQGDEDGAPHEMLLQYSGYDTPYNGNFNFGHSQYTIQYRAGYRQLAASTSQWTVSGIFPNAAHISVRATYTNGLRIAYAGEELNAVLLGGGRAPNPFMAGYPTLLTYPDQRLCAADPQVHHRIGDGDFASAVRSRPSLVMATQPQANLTAKFGAMCRWMNTNVFRLSEDLTKMISDAGDTSPGCSEVYLYSPALEAGADLAARLHVATPGWNMYSFTYGFIRCRIPHMFKPFAERIFDPNGYDALAFDVSSHWLSPPAPHVPFTVTSRMLETPGFYTAVRSAYILFAPAEIVKEMERPNPAAPPVVYIPRLQVSAYVLAAPNFLFAFRYYSPSKTWRGSPANAPCARDFLTSLRNPATCDDLGDYLPQITRMDGAQDLQDLISQMVKLIL